MSMVISSVIGIPNANLATSEDIPQPIGSLYELEESTFNYRLESGEGYYKLERNYIAPPQFRYMLEDFSGSYELEESEGAYLIDGQ